MRKALLIIAFLVAGAIANVAVAWLAVACDLRLDPSSEPGTRRWYGSIPSSPDISAKRHDRWLSTYFYCTRNPEREYEVRHSPFAVDDMPVPKWSRVNTLPAIATMWERACGWPLRSLRSCAVMTYNDPKDYGSIRRGTLVVSGGLALNRGLYDTRRILPYNPIWLGMAINSIFYAGILWLLFAAPFRLRSWRRIKRGLCPACAYPVGESEVCTECGGKLMRDRMGLPPPATPAASAAVRDTMKRQA